MTTTKNYPTAPTKFGDQLPADTSLLLEAALCSWEWMLDNRFSPNQKAASKANPQNFNDWEFALDAAWEKLGASAMRHCSMQAGAIVLTVWDHMEASGYEHDGATYDWEFVPAVLSRLDWDKLTTDNQYNGEPYWPDPAPIFAAMMADDPEHFRNDTHERLGIIPVADWLAEARRYAEFLYCYEGLPDDNPADAKAAFEAGENVYAYIEALGEKFDLNRQDQDWGIRTGEVFAKRLPDNR